MNEARALVAEMRALAEKVTHENWRVWKSVDGLLLNNHNVLADLPDGAVAVLFRANHYVIGDDDVAFAARSRSAIPELCDALTKALDELDGLRS